MRIKAFFPQRDIFLSSVRKKREKKIKLDRTVMKFLLTLTKMTSSEIRDLHARFSRVAPSGRMNFLKFREILGLLGAIDATFLSSSIFKAFDINEDKMVDFFEFTISLSIMIRGSDDDKLNFSFAMLQKNIDDQLAKSYGFRSKTLSPHKFTTDNNGDDGPLKSGILSNNLYSRNRFGYIDLSHLKYIIKSIHETRVSLLGCFSSEDCNQLLPSDLEIEQIFLSIASYDSNDDTFKIFLDDFKYAVHNSIGFLLLLGIFPTQFAVDANDDIAAYNLVAVGRKNTIKREPRGDSLMRISLEIKSIIEYIRSIKENNTPSSVINSPKSIQKGVENNDSEGLSEKYDGKQLNAKSFFCEDSLTDYRRSSLSNRMTLAKFSLIDPSKSFNSTKYSDILSNPNCDKNFVPIMNNEARKETMVKFSSNIESVPLDEPDVSTIPKFPVANQFLIYNNNTTTLDDSLSLSSETKLEAGNPKSAIFSIVVDQENLTSTSAQTLNLGFDSRQTQWNSPFPLLQTNRTDDSLSQIEQRLRSLSRYIDAHYLRVGQASILPDLMCSYSIQNSVSDDPSLNSDSRSPKSTVLSDERQLQMYMNKAKRRTRKYAPTTMRSKKEFRFLKSSEGLTVYFGHESWDMVLCMMIGIRLAAIKASIDPKEKLSQRDFNFKEEFTISHETLYNVAQKNKKTEFPTKFGVSKSHSNLDEKKFQENDISSNSVKFIDYAPSAFRNLREIFGISAEEYLRSVGPEQLISNMILGNLSSLSELVSSGKSL